MQHEQRERQQQRQVNRAAGHHGVVTCTCTCTCVVPVLKSAVGNGGSLFAGLAFAVTSRLSRRNVHRFWGRYQDFHSMPTACRMRRGAL